MLCLNFCVAKKWSLGYQFRVPCLLQKWLCGIVVTEEKIKEAKEIFDAHLGPGCFNEEGMCDET